MRAVFSALVVATAVILQHVAIAADAIPKLEVETLSKKSLTLPQDLPATTALYVIGFSKGSSEHTALWSENLAQHIAPLGVNVYSVSVLEEVPWFVRGMVVSSIRSDVPAAHHDHFFIATSDSAAWKEVAAYSKADDAYLVLTDTEHKIRWFNSGPYSQAMLEAVKQQISLQLEP